MGWFQFYRKKLHYNCSITKTDGLEEWVESLVDDMSQDVKFSIFGKKYATKKAIVENLVEVTSEETIKAILEKEAGSYLDLIGDLSEYYPANNLPATKNFPLIVVVPRMILNRYYYENSKKNLMSSHELSKLQNSDLLINHLSHQLVVELDKTLIEQDISQSASIHCGKGWKIIGKNNTYKWFGSFEGHYITFRPLEKKTGKKELVALKNELDVWLGKLSKEEKTEMIGKTLLYYNLD